MKELKIIAEYPQYGVTDNGRVYSFKSNRWLKPYKTTNGYLSVRLSNVPNKVKNLLVHRLVGEMFLPKEIGKNYINHKDLDKTNNRLSNLEWCTPKENSQHAQLNGAMHDVSCKLTEREVLVFSMIEAGVRVKEIAFKAGVSRQLITHVKKGRTWVKAAKEYGFKPLI